MRWLTLLLLCACTNRPETHDHWQTIPARESKLPLYRAQVPLSWKRIETVGPNTDTRIPNISFEIDELQITIHSFPNHIPPEAQVARWQRQESEEGTISSFTRAGFSGLKLRSQNLLAYALQLDPKHANTLSFLAKNALERSYATQMASDVTIKISGPRIEEHLEEISLFVYSFELISEIPS